MVKLILALLISAPIVALLATLAASTTNPVTFWAASAYAAIVGLSGLLSVLK